MNYAARSSKIFFFAQYSHKLQCIIIIIVRNPLRIKNDESIKMEDINMEACASYGIHSAKPTVEDQVYEECDVQVYEEM